MNQQPSSTIKIYWNLILGLAGLKLLIHFFGNSLSFFGLHRDEYLYISESDHLAWGYMEVPPMIAVIGKITRSLFGDSLFSIRLFPALVGAATIILIGIMIRDLGGKKYAQFLGCLGFLLSPAFLGSNNLFQPVSFNQFFWFLSAFFMVKIIKRYQETEDVATTQMFWYLLGVSAGLGFLTKYSIVFFFVALISAIALTPHRRFLLSRYPYISLGIAFMISLPNLWWQYSHDFPVIRHMHELATSQLVNMDASSFVTAQILDHFACTLIWLPGLIFVLFHRSMKEYRFIGLAYILVVGLIGVMSGKDYYTFGSYPMLFAAGGIAWESWIGKKSLWLVPIILLANLPSIPLVIPLLPPKNMQDYGIFMRDRMGLEGLFRWEDGKVRNMRQDYADMLGWEEIPEKVANLYYSLTEEERAKCIIEAGHYGQAGVLNLYKGKYDLPTTYSFNASFISWVPEDLDFEIVIQVDDVKQDDSSYFESVILMDSIENEYARDPGYIYLKSEPKEDLRPIWRELVRERKKKAGL